MFAVAVFEANSVAVAVHRQMMNMEVVAERLFRSLDNPSPTKLDKPRAQYIDLGRNNFEKFDLMKYPTACTRQRARTLPPAAG